MKKVIRLTESDLVRIVKRVLIESNGSNPGIPTELYECLSGAVGELSPSCLTVVNIVFGEVQKKQTEGKIPTIEDITTILTKIITNPDTVTSGMACATELMFDKEKQELIIDCIFNNIPKPDTEGNLAKK
jgi:hypothetical protein